MKLAQKTGLAACALLAMSGLAACGSDSGDGGTESKVLKVAFNQSETHPQYVAMEEFGKKLEERTDGAYSIDMFPNELLGAQQETITGVQSGSIDMSIVVGSLMENVNPDFVAFDLPYAFESVDQQMSVLNDPEITGELYSSMQDQGVHVAGAFHSGVRNVYTKNSPVEETGDLNGQKIRVIQNDTMVEMMNLMGGVGTAMGQGDVYTAIQSGVLDGGENNELIFNSLKHDEVAPYYSYTQHLMVPDYLIVNATLFEGMSAEHQEIFNEEFAAAVESEVSLWDEAVTEARTAAEEAGATFTEIDTAPFKQAVQPLVDKKLESSETARKLYDAAQAAA
jgi:tripartite ATP-independent transporter DctP family solute receptor